LKNMRVLIDANVIMDYITKREPYADDAYKIAEMCVKGKIDGCIAAHTVINLFFILRKSLSVEERKAVLLKLCRAFTVIGIDNIKLISCLKNGAFKDFEDCLQEACASDFNADYLITRNLNDFKNSRIKAIEPSVFLINFR